MTTGASINLADCNSISARLKGKGIKLRRYIVQCCIHVVLFVWFIFGVCTGFLTFHFLVYINERNKNDPLSGTSKWEVYSNMLKNNRNPHSHFAESVFIPKDSSISSKINVVETWMSQVDESYPIILKPDKGVRSIGAFRIRDKVGLSKVLSVIKNDYLAQAYDKNLKEEVSLFFMRETDGFSTYFGLAAKLRICRTMEESVTPLKYMFSIKDYSHKLSPELLSIFQNISDDLYDFNVGRYDIVVDNVESFCKGNGHFKIIEVNMGPDTTMLHAYDPDHTLSKTWSLIFRKWTQIYKIGIANMDQINHKISLLGVIKRYYAYGKELSHMDTQV